MVLTKAHVVPNGQQRIHWQLPPDWNLLGVFLGGPGPSKRDFMDAGHLHHEVAKKIVEPYFDTGYTDEYGLRELAEMVADTQHQLSISREKKLMQRLLREITKQQGGLAVYGEEHVRAAISAVGRWVSKRRRS
jgi:peptide chain release factor subunit 1